MKAYYSIGKVCGTKAGLTAIIYTDMTNISNYGPGHLPPSPGNLPSFIDSNKLYSISFERYSAELTKESKVNGGGDYDEIDVTAFVPRSRSEVEMLLSMMRNRLLFIIGIDRHGNQHLLYNAVRTYRHSTGSRPSTKHGYQISFNATGHYLLPSIAGNGDIETAPPLPGGGGGGGSSSGCCVTVNPIGIAYTPTPTGNALNHNQMVTTTSGAVYFIDGDGRGILLLRPAPQYYVVQISAAEVPPTSVVLPSWFWIPDPADYPAPTYDTQAEMSRAIQCIMATREITYDHADGWYLDYGTRTAHFNVPIDEAVISFYSHQDIKPRPL